ncbi:MAG: transporter substrate-binding domain-containing protein [Clostridia bacterium]|nr:transporter substrate-binding domain-containing protein [Clostridia bacterium]
MKRMLAIVLAVCMLVLGMTSCGNSSASDMEYVKEKGKLIVGITDFAPMDYEKVEGSEEWIGFDADMAKKFAEHLDVEVEFIEINWGTKATTLETKVIDVVWNGMTITDEVKGLMGVSEPYCMNAQVVVMKNDIAANYTTTDSLKSLTFAVEDGSAGAKALDALGITYTACDDQAKALMEVAAGSTQACVIDLLMAGAMIGEGTSYPTLVKGLELTSEQYGVGFRKDSDLIAEFNKFWKAAYDAGTVTEVATTYGIAQNIIAK